MNNNRTVWIVVIVILVILLLCCCALVVGAAVTGLLTAVPVSREAGFARVEERSEQVFTVGDAPMVEIDNFAGDVTIRPGDGDEIRIVVTKKASSRNRLDLIDVDVVEVAGGVRINTSSRRTVSGMMSVDVELSVPPDARLDLETGAGNVQVDDVAGEMGIHTGAGNIDVRGAQASVALDTGAGNVTYQGDPRGECSFGTGAGNVALRLPADLDVEVRLTTGIGNVSLGGFDVEGDVSRTEVDGVVGTGEQATIEAHTGAGNVSLSQQ